jgi:ADP-heptose:LPS heptosyltransferase
MGDAVMLLPMLEQLRRAHPGATIELAIGAPVAPLFQMIPELDRVYALKLRAALPATRRMRLDRIIDLARFYYKEMRDCIPGVCIMPRWGDDLFCGQFLGYLAGARRRIGFSATSGSSARDSLLTEAYRAEGAEHETQRFCRLLSLASLIPSVEAKDLLCSPIKSLQGIAEQNDWNALSTRLGVDQSAPYAVIAPGASQPNRRWPNDRWAEVMQSLHRTGLKIVLLAGPKDAFVARALHESASVPSVLVAGTTTIPESITLLSRAELFLGNDSGPGHAAGAVGVPTVTLFIDDGTGDPHGPSSPVRISPVGPHLASCRPPRCLPPCVGYCSASSLHCIQEISAKQVIATADSLLTEAKFPRMNPGAFLLQSSEPS